MVEEALMDKTGAALLKRGPDKGSRLLKGDGVGVMDGDINKVACIMVVVVVAAAAAAAAVGRVGRWRRKSVGVLGSVVLERND